jgi:hypothetical protein
MKIKADVGKVAHKSDSKLEIKTDTVIKEEDRKLFDDNGKLIAVNHKETAKIDELGLLKKKAAPSKKTSKPATKTPRPWKYNTPTKELVVLLEQYKKINDEHLGELTAFIEKRRQRWKNFYESNKDKYKQWSSNWRKNNPDKVKASQQRYAEKVKSQKAKSENPASTTKKSKKSSKKNK